MTSLREMKEASDDMELAEGDTPMRANVAYLAEVTEGIHRRLDVLEKRLQPVLSVDETKGTFENQHGRSGSPLAETLGGYANQLSAAAHRILILTDRLDV